MLKLLLTVKSVQQDTQRDTIYRTLLWPTKPNIGENFWYSRGFDYNGPVMGVSHYPPGDYIEISFEVKTDEEIDSLLNEREGGWLTDEQVDNSLVWKLEP